MKNYVPKIAAIHDISGVGRCSMTVILPILSALGCQVCPLPTALLSSHSEYKDFYFFDFTEHMKEYYSFWEMNSIEFDCIYSGFIGSEHQINIISDIFNKVNKEETIIVVDPVMGDHGFTYKTYNDNMIKKMGHLVEKANIITPNLTEAAILLGEKYRADKFSILELKKYLKNLSDMGPETVVITGVKTDKGENINVCYDKKNNKYWKIPFDYINTRYPGTGDLFTSLFVGYLFNNKKLPEAIEQAAKFVSLAVLKTYDAKTPNQEGVLFEIIMEELYKDIREYNYCEI